MAIVSRKNMHGFLSSEYQDLIRSLLSSITDIKKENSSCVFDEKRIYMIRTVPKFVQLGGPMLMAKTVWSWMKKIVDIGQNYTDSVEASHFCSELQHTMTKEYNNLKTHPFLYSATEKQWKVVQTIATARMVWSSNFTKPGEPNCPYQYHDFLCCLANPTRSWKALVTAGNVTAYLNVFNRRGGYDDTCWDLVRYMRNVCMHINDYDGTNMSDEEIMAGLLSMFPGICLELYELGKHVGAV